ncbi:hypothetical protein PHAVU_008G252700 [Phaseolus vulgaris]|uniref:Uncharacterized protein n=1 Tax=Phaseolus vulgaris TaxID=3885 RepID=V7B8D3_PHAVU|nr:hypothetical protein PHAVU_008G252700g [Phaseolus vulgaris]ESW14094.1 hypothetical protein PHAVU_008G252700g [Phaseolus vulgaris]
MGPLQVTFLPLAPPITCNWPSNSLNPSSCITLWIAPLSFVFLLFSTAHNSSLTSLGQLRQGTTFPFVPIKCCFPLVIPPIIIFLQLITKNLICIIFHDRRVVFPS